ncbi:MAG: hypothetical protein HC772_04165 [Leptolyngbyaceae cyanobacterium CRU_2_3]|nr:hypothetical protein [Leptolyngbyaceae cyanobacterium CRU_2_3]
MSQQGNFFGGFLLGTVVGGVVGGVVGVLTASRLSQAELPNSESFSKVETKTGKKRTLKPSTEQGIEVARRGLEDKIAQLNDAIDDVRQQLGTVNGTSQEHNKGKAIAQDP